MTGPRTRPPRFSVGGLQIIYDTGESFWSAPVVNISDRGLFVETHHELPVGTRVTIHPDTSEDDQLPFEVHGEVVRVKEFDPERIWDQVPGLAFQLVDLPDDHFEQLKKFLGAHGVQVG